MREPGRDRRTNRQRRHTPASCVDSIMAYDKEAFDKAQYVSIGKLGGSKEITAHGARAAISATDPCTRLKCTHCGALLFPEESTFTSKKGQFGTIWHGGQLCCATGKVRLPPIKRSAQIEECWTRFGDLLMKHARGLNNSLAMASMPVKKPELPGSSGYRPGVSIQGKLHHYVGSLELPTADDIPAAFAQLYVHDPVVGAVSDTRMGGGRFKIKNEREKARVKALLDELHNALVAANPYVQDIKTAAEIFREAGQNMLDAMFVIDNTPRYAIQNVADTHTIATMLHACTICSETCCTQPVASPNLLTLFELASIVRSNGDSRTYSTNRQGYTFNEVKVYHNEAAAKHKIEIRFRDGAHHETDEQNRAYDPLHFVLLFPEGDDGWQPYIPHVHPVTNQDNVEEDGPIFKHGKTIVKHTIYFVCPQSH